MEQYYAAHCRNGSGPGVPIFGSLSVPIEEHRAAARLAVYVWVSLRKLFASGQELERCRPPNLSFR